ncbi:MAG: hypothetical protein ACXABY_13540 [Candidatus Thorarchaeota archaeon]
MSIRSMFVAVFAAIISVSIPVMGLADGISTPPPVVAQSEGIGGWFSSKASAISQFAGDKYTNLTDPDQKIKLLKAKIIGLEQQVAELTTELTVKELRVQVRTQDLVTLRESVSDLNLLFVTGRMKHLIEVVPDGPPRTE